MKKSILMIVALFCATMSFAQQQGGMAVGVTAGYGTAYEGSYNNIGIGAKFQYNVTDPIRAELEVNGWLKKDNMTMWDATANIHYLFNVSPNFNVYPLAGLGMYGWKVSYDFSDSLGEYADYAEEHGIKTKGSESDSKFGFRLGGGCEYKVASDVAVGAELKYHILPDKMSHLTIQLGVTYSF